MTRDEIIAELEQILQRSIAALTEMRRWQIHSLGEDDCTECWVQGHEDATLYYEDMIDELMQLSRNINQSDVLFKPHVAVSDKQQKLPLDTQD